MVLMYYIEVRGIRAECDTRPKFLHQRYGKYILLLCTHFFATGFIERCNYHHTEHNQRNIETAFFHTFFERSDVCAFLFHSLSVLPLSFVSVLAMNGESFSNILVPFAKMPNSLDFNIFFV